MAKAMIACFRRPHAFDSLRFTALVESRLTPDNARARPACLHTSDGVVSCVYHLANGIWTAGITWGLWITPAAQKRADYICAAFGVLFTIVGLGALYGVGRADVTQAKAVEQARIEQKESLERREHEIEHEQQAETAMAPAADVE